MLALPAYIVQRSLLRIEGVSTVRSSRSVRFSAVQQTEEGKGIVVQFGFQRRAEMREMAPVADNETYPCDYKRGHWRIQDKRTLY